MFFLIIFLYIVAVRIYAKLTTGMCKSTDKMHNKVVLITGANTGIGYETAKDLAMRGAKVILACRDEKKAIIARDNIIKETGNLNVVYKHIDLTSFASVRQFAEDILKSESHLDVLINNAGTGNAGNFLTSHNIPYEVQVNHFSPFLLTNLLLPLLKTSAPSRIINVASGMHYIGRIDLDKFDKQASSFIGRLRVYSDTKLGNILFTRKLSQMLRGTGVTANSLHPGAVNTEIFRYNYLAPKFITTLLLKTPKEGAQTSIYLAVSKDVENVNGEYFADCCEAKQAAHAQDDEMADKLWKLSERIVSSVRKDD